MCPLPSAAAPIAASLGLGACLGQRCYCGVALRPTASCDAPEHPVKPPGTHVHFWGVGLWGGPFVHTHPAPRSLSAQPFVRASTVSATLQSEQWGPGLFPPPRTRHPPRSRRDFGKTINTRWERAGLPGTHSPCAKSFWREWARGPGRMGVPVLPETARLVPQVPAASWGRGQLGRDPQPPAPLCSHGCLGKGTHPLCWRLTQGRCHPVLGHSPTLHPPSDFCQPREATSPAVAWGHRPL